MKRYYISKIIGTGSMQDPYRPAVADEGVSWVGDIPSDPDGRPLYDTCLVLVNSKVHSKLRTHPDIDALPDFPLDGKVSAIQQQTKTGMITALKKRGFDTAGLENKDGYRDVLQSIGKQRSPHFDLDNFDVEE